MSAFFGAAPAAAPPAAPPGSGGANPLSSFANRVSTAAQGAARSLGEATAELRGEMRGELAELRSSLPEVPLLKSVGAAASAAAAKAGAGASAAAAAASGAASSLRDSASAGLSTLQSLTQERLLFAVCLSASSSIFLSLALFVGLPQAPLAPSRFALPFTLGSMCNLCALGALRGPQGQLSHMMAPGRIWISTLYVGSMLLTLWACLVWHSYILTMFCSCVQLLALLYYTISYFPGGKQGFWVILTAARRAAGPALSACWAATSACWSDPGSAERGFMRDLLPI